jgi:hypothetical protein
LHNLSHAQVELKTYADSNGYVDVQKLTCAQLANTFQEDADYLTVWYSGWYNGLAKKHMMQVDRAKSLEHQIIVYCKANRDTKVIEAIDVVLQGLQGREGHQNERVTAAFCFARFHALIICLQAIVLPPKVLVFGGH